MNNSERAFMSIKETSIMTGLSYDTLRTYERFQLIAPCRNKSNKRQYSKEDVLKIAIIVTYKFLGFNLKKIKDFLNSEEDLQNHLRCQFVIVKKYKSIFSKMEVYLNQFSDLGELPYTTLESYFELLKNK